MSNVTQEERIKEVEEAVGNIVNELGTILDLTTKVKNLQDRVRELEEAVGSLVSLTDRMQIAFETTHSRLTNLETKVSKLERK